MLTNKDYENVLGKRFELIKNKKYLALLAIVILAVIISMSIFHNNISATKLDVNRSNTITARLDAMYTILKEVANNPSNSKQEKIALERLEDNIFSVKKSLINVAKSSDIQQVSKQISLVKDDIDSQMLDLKKSVSSSLGNKEYLDSSLLPFQVISIDVIGGEPYISINYADHISPLGVGDLLVGWRVTSADSDQGIAVFVNEKNQFIRISLQGV